MPAYKDTKTNTWYCKFYYSNYEGEKKQKLKRGFALKRDAEAFERDFLNNIAFQPDMTFGAFYELFQRDTEPRLKQHTVQYRHYVYKNRIAPYFSSKTLADISGQVVAQWQNELISEGLSATYLNNCHAVLSSVFNHAVRFYGLKINPCKVAGSIGNKKPRHEMQIWTLDEYKRHIQHVEDIKARTAITLLFWSGLRKGELLALTWADIDFSSGMLRVNKSYQRIGGCDVVTPPKTEKSKRTIGLPKQALEALATYRGHCFSSEPSEAVFTWEKRFIELGIMKGCELSGVKRIRVHDLRHSHASHLIELGFSPILIAQRLGHEKIETTLNTYSHLWPNKEAEMLKKLSSE